MLRRGAGSVKHLSVRDLWGQEIVRDYGVLVEKIDRKDNSADAMASACVAKDLDRHMASIGIEFKDLPEEHLV